MTAFYTPAGKINIIPRKCVPASSNSVNGYRGNTATAQKNFTKELERETYDAILKFDCVLLLLDWDNRVYMPNLPPQFRDKRLIHMRDFRKLSLVELAYLMSRCACFCGIDSGPLHMCEKWSNCPAVGVWFGHHPAHYSIPRDGVTHLVEDRPQWADWNRERAKSFNLSVCEKVTAERIAELVAKCL